MSIRDGRSCILPTPTLASCRSEASVGHPESTWGNAPHHSVLLSCVTIIVPAVCCFLLVVKFGKRCCRTETRRW